MEIYQHSLNLRKYTFIKGSMILIHFDILIKISIKQIFIENSQNKEIYTENQNMQHSQPLFKFQHKQSCPVTLNNSNQVSFEQPARKFSMASLNQAIDLQKVMIDIKLTPLKSNQFQQKIKTIYSCLDYLKKISPSLLEQVRTAQLIIQNIEIKFLKHHAQTKRSVPERVQSVQKNSALSSQSKFENTKIKDQQILLSKRKASHNVLNTYSQISPIKQLDDMTSRIVYTNFSLKDLENSCNKIQSNRKHLIQRQSLSKRQQQQILKPRQSSSKKQSRIQSESKPKSYKKQMGLFTVSKFDPEDEQMQRLTKNIEALDKVLEQKGLGITNIAGKQILSSKGVLRQSFQNNQRKSIFKSDKKTIMLGHKNKNSANKQNWYC